MNSRELVLRALEFRGPPRLPMNYGNRDEDYSIMGMTDPSYQWLREAFGSLAPGVSRPLPCRRAVPPAGSTVCTGKRGSSQ